MNNKILQQKIEFLPGVGPKKSTLLNKEIGVYTINDMLHYFPFRYEDRSKIRKLSEVTENDFDGVFLVQALKKISSGLYNKKRLTVKIKDSSGFAELIWFKGIKWIEKKILIGKKYLIFGKPKLFNKTILDHQIDVYKKCGFNNIHIVTGYCSNKIEALGYNTTINCNSLFKDFL